MQMVLKNGMINVYFKEEIEWDLEKTFYGVEQLLPINVKVPGKEGGKGISCSDVETAGDNVTGAPRRLTDGVIEGEDYPNHVGVDFIIIIKKMLLCLQKWDLKHLELLLHGLVFSLEEMKKNQMKKV